MDISKALAFATVMDIQDGYRAVEERVKLEASKQEVHTQICFEEFIDSSVRLMEEVCKVCEQANPYLVPVEIADGSFMLPVYIFMMVLRAQGGHISSGQSLIMDAYFEKINVGFSKREMIEALSNNNDARQRVRDIVGITNNFAGTFWVTLFKAMYAIKSNEEPLNTLIENFTIATMRFAVLGETQNQVIITVCEKFEYAVLRQVIECKKLPARLIDYFGEVAPGEHLIRIADIAFDLYDTAGEPKDPDMEQTFPLFFAGLVRGLIDMSSLSEKDKGLLLERFLQRYDIEVIFAGINYSGIMLFLKLNDGSSRQKLLTNMQELISRMMQIMFQLIMMLSIRADKKNETTAFISACAGFLYGIEKELAIEYPQYGFGRLTSTYISNELAKLT